MGMWDFLSDMGSGAEAISAGGDIATGVAAGGGGGGGGWSWGGIADAIGKGATGFGNFAKDVMPAVNLGLGGLGAYNMIQGGQQLGEQTKIADRSAATQAQIAARAQDTAAPMAALSKTELEQAMAGKIDPAVQSQIDLWTQGAKQKAQQYAASSGQGNSQQLVTWLSWIDQQAEAMKAQALQDQKSSGIAAGSAAGGVLSTASGASGSAGQTAATQAQSIENLIGQANKVMASLTAGAA